MIKRFVAFGLLLGLVMISVAYGQKATEIYIPIGKSPGLSGKYSVIGEIASFNEDSKTLTIRHDGVEYSAKITEETKIWLDKSEIRQTNEVATPADCQAGRLCEIKYVYDGETRTSKAEWIKIQISRAD
jgi:hypothetical protein